jgi:hypothetical protein
MTSRSHQKYDCDRCGFTFDKADLKRQRGLLLCTACFDGADPDTKVHWGFYGAQAGTDKTIYYVDMEAGFSWQENHMLVAQIPDYILTETGSYFLMETGDKTANETQL